jgi:hypothetical protein
VGRHEARAAILSRDGRHAPTNRVGLAMTEEQSRTREYLSRAAEMRRLAQITRYPEVRTRLLMMAAGFERLADQVERWENTRVAITAD